MTKEKLIKLIDVEDNLKIAVRNYLQSNREETVGLDEIIENLRVYISLMNEYCHDSDTILLAYENYVRSISDPFTTYEKTTRITRVYRQLNNCISLEHPCSKCEYYGSEECTRELLKDATEILKMFIEIK